LNSLTSGGALDAFRLTELLALDSLLGMSAFLRSLRLGELRGTLGLGDAGDALSREEAKGSNCPLERSSKGGADGSNGLSCT
jgi:hypothetical protein